MKWFKIGTDNFVAKEISVQYNIDTANNSYGYARIVHNSRPHIDITIIMDNTQNNSTYFFNLYNQRGQGPASEYKFDINAHHFNAKGCMIRSISTDPLTNTLTMDIICDWSTVVPIDERRNEIIEQILDETSEKKNNINS